MYATPKLLAVKHKYLVANLKVAIMDSMGKHENLKLIAFVGLSGSGKSVAVDYFTKLGYPKVYFGGVVLDLMTKAGLEHTQENEKPFREKLRQEFGKEFVVENIIKQIRDLQAAGQRRVIADGLYSWTEYKRMKHEFPGELTVVAIVTDRHLRYKRMANRPVRPLTAQGIDERDWSEIEGIEKGGPIAIADFFVHNDGSVEELESQLTKIARNIEFNS